MFVHLSVEERGLRSLTAVRHGVQPGWMIAATAATAGGQVGGSEPGVALGRQVGEEMTPQFVGDVRGEAALETLGELGGLLPRVVPVVPGVSAGVSAVRPGGGAGQVSQGLQPAPGQVGLLHVVAQEAAREGKEGAVSDAGLQVGAEDGEPGAGQPQ